LDRKKSLSIQGGVELKGRSVVQMEAQESPEALSNQTEKGGAIKSTSV